MPRESRQAPCHPQRRHYALGKCQRCYYKARRDAGLEPYKPRPKKSRVAFAGWGSNPYADRR